jgi:hypothetical protein
LILYFLFHFLLFLHVLVPIYNGCGRNKKDYNGFSFDDEDWEGLTSLPLYEKEIPVDALVTVGFTLAGPWTLSGPHDPPTGHFYIAFAIVLALPV